MYKKNKATKNNSLKKASISTAVAALASVAALSGVEPFNPDSASMTFARGRRFFADNLWSRGLNRYGGRYNRRGLQGLFGDLYGYGYGIDPKLDENQKENAEIEQNNAQGFCASFAANLTDEAVKAKLYNVCKAPVSIYDGVIKLLLTDKNESYKKVVEIFRRVSMSGGLAHANSLQAQALKALKTYSQEVLRQFSEVVMSYRLSRSDNPSTVAEMQGIAKGFKCKPELVKLANIRAIFEGDNLEEARSICEKAVMLLFEGKTFSDLAEENFEKRMTSAYRFDTSLKLDKVSEALKPLYAVLDTFLCTIQSVNDVIKELFAQQVVHNMRKYIAGMALKGETDLAVAFGGKEYLGSFASMTGSTTEQTFILPLLLSDNINYDKAVKSRYRSFVEGDIFNLKQALVDSLRGRGDFRRALDDYLSKVTSDSNRFDNDSDKVEFSYDFAALMEEAVGSRFTRECFSKLEALRQDLLGKNYNQMFGTPEAEAASKAQFHLTDGDVALIKEAKADFDGNGDTHFVKPDGTVPPFRIVFGMPDQPNSYLSERGKKTLAVYGSMPNLLKYSGLLEILMSIFDSRSRGGASVYDNSLSPLFDEATFVSGVRSAMSAISSLFEKTRGLMKSLARAKASEPYNKKERVKAADKDVCCVLPLNEGNLNIDKYKFDFEGGTLRLSNLPEEFKQVSVVVCPKNADKSNKSGNKDFDGPVVDVRNGVAAFDSASLFTPGAGAYELHFRNEVKDDKGNVTDHKFFCKCKLVYKLGESVHANVVQEDKVEQNSSDSIVDLSSSEIYVNKDNTISVSCKAGKDAPKHLTAVFFAEGVPANLEVDKFCMELINGKYEAQFPPVKKGKWQLHMYNGEIAKENYVGKIVFDTDKSKEIKVKEVGSFVDAVSSDDSVGKRATVVKTLQITLPKEGFSDDDDYRKTTLPYDLLYSNGEKALSSDMSLEYVGETSDGNGVIYKAKVEVASTTSEQRIAITDDEGDRIEADKTINSETGVNEKIDLSRGRRSSSKDDWFYNLGNRLDDLYFRF